MPVVSADWLDPSGWASAAVSRGVSRDGEVLRFARASRGGSFEIDTVSLNDWQTGCAMRTRVEADLKKGARLVAGLPPSRVMLRTLISPLSDPLKSAEIWPSLLDASLPFPLESCLVAFGEGTKTEEGGMSCLAAAIRIEDLQAECEAWQALGLDPEWLVPEALVISQAVPGVHVWVGKTRSVFVHWGQSGFSACGGAKDPARDGKTLMRFLGALPDSADPIWVGPGGEDDPDVLERGLALAGLGQGKARMNLRGEAVGHPGLLQRAKRTRQMLLGLFIVMMMAAVGMPLTLRSFLNQQFTATQVRMAEGYRDVTGEMSPPGQERLLMERWIEQEWGSVRAAAERVFTPGVSTGMREVFTVSARVGVTVRTLKQDRASLRVSFQANREAAERFETELGHFGWRGELAQDTADVWTYMGGKEL